MVPDGDGLSAMFLPEEQMYSIARLHGWNFTRMPNPRPSREELAMMIAKAEHMMKCVESLPCLSSPQRSSHPTALT